MRTKFMRNTATAALGLLVISANAAAQTPPVETQPLVPTTPAVEPAKPTVETAVTPVEQIKLNGRTLPLNIKTLAEIQRLTEEKELREKIAETLKTGGAIQIPASNTQATAAQANPSTAPVKRASKPAAPRNTLVAVFGPANALKAEVQVGNNQSRQLQKGDAFGNFRVASISQSGIQLEPLSGPRGNTRFVSVGQQLAN